MNKEKSCENCMFMKKHNNKCYCYETIYPKKCPAKFICGGWQLKNEVITMTDFKILGLLKETKEEYSHKEITSERNDKMEALNYAIFLIENQCKKFEKKD